MAWDACLRSAALLRGGRAFCSRVWRAPLGCGRGVGVFGRTVVLRAEALRETVGVVLGRLRYSDGRYCAVEISSGRGGVPPREPMRSGIVSEASACIRLTMLDATDLRRWAERCYRASRTCFDLSAATELRVLGDELTARAIEVERAAYVDMRRVCVGDDNLR